MEGGEEEPILSNGEEEKKGEEEEQQGGGGQPNNNNNDNNNSNNNNGNGEDDEEEESVESVFGPELIKLLFRRFQERPIPVHVHKVHVRGNARTKDSVIHAYLAEVKEARTMQELMERANFANAELERLGIFEKCSITLDAGPKEFPHSANVLVKVEEAKRTYSGDFGIYSKPETRNWSLEGSLKWKNLLGYGETWDGTSCYGLDTTSEMSAGLYYPKFKGLTAALVSRISLLTHDWHKYSSYNERLLGISASLIADKYHELSYNLTWRALEDPSHTASRSVRRQLGHTLLSAAKYTFKIDHRDSLVRPTRGYAFSSMSQFAGIGPDNRLLRFIRQELEFRFAIPLGFYNAALNFGIAGGIIMPWGEGFRSKTTPISDRFFMGGHASLVCDMRGPTTLSGFRSRGVGPSEVRCLKTPPPTTTNKEEDDNTSSPKRDVLGGDLAVTGFVDLSFDLPFRILRNNGIHGHCFVCAGNLSKLTGEDQKPLSSKDFYNSFRSSAGAGIVIPTNLIRIEVNYCRILRQLEHDRGRHGLRFSFSSPH